MTRGILVVQFVILRANMREMKMAMVFVKFTSILWKGFGLYFALGYALIGEFPRQIYPAIWHFLRPFTISGEEAADYSALCYN